MMSRDNALWSVSEDLRAGRPKCFDAAVGARVGCEKTIDKSSLVSQNFKEWN